MHPTHAHHSLLQHIKGAVSVHIKLCINVMFVSGNLCSWMLLYSVPHNCLLQGPNANNVSTL